MEFVLGEATVSIRVRSMRMHGFLMRVFQSKRFYLVFCLTVSLFFRPFRVRHITTGLGMPFTLDQLTLLLMVLVRKLGI